MIKVYLGGNALFAFYRKYAKAKFGDQLNLLDPIERNCTEIDEVKGVVTINCSVENLVESDKSWVQGSDIFVALVNESTFGTTMEILHAYNNQIPVYVILGSGSFRLEKDFWLSYHTTKFFLSNDPYKDGIDKCFNYIIDTLKSN